MVKGLIHDTQALIYNMDETSVCAKAKGKIIVPKGKHPYVAEYKLIGHMTACLTCNAAGEALRPLIILPTLVNLPAELKDLEPQWMMSRIFLFIYIIGQIFKEDNQISLEKVDFPIF